MSTLGFLDLDNVWLDDRRACRWALRGLDLTVEPGQLVAILGDPETDGAGAVLDIFMGRRRPVRGHASIDGITIGGAAVAARPEVTELGLVEGGERRLCAGPTQLVVRPTAATLASADLVVVLDDGVVRTPGTHREQAAS